MQRGLLSNFGHEGHRIFTVWLGPSPTVGLTTRCSGLASLAAELGIVRPQEIVRNMQFEQTALVRHYKTAAQMDKSLAISGALREDNYLAFEADTVDFIARHQRRLHPDVIQALGFAYLRTAVPLISPYLNGRILTFAEAERCVGPKGVSNIRIFTDSDGTDTWARDADCAIKAAVALRHLDVVPDRARVHGMLEAIGTAMDAKHYEYQRTRARLLWSLIDPADLSGHAVDALFELARQRVPEIARDIAVTFLKAGDTERVASLYREFGAVYTCSSEFVYWPVLNFLHTRGVVARREYGLLRVYVGARKKGKGPPSWWSWLD